MGVEVLALVAILAMLTRFNGGALRSLQARPPWRKRMHIVSIITGPMFSGKTSALVDRWRARQGEKLVFKHAIDNGRCYGNLSSHDPEYHGKIAAIPIGGLHQVFEHLDEKTEHVFIDECQFFNLEQTVMALRKLRELRPNLTLTFAGLDLNFRGEPWETTAYIKTVADERVEVQGVCVCCQKPATHSFRKDAVRHGVVVGGLDKYEPRCHGCHRKGMEEFVT